MKVLLIIKGPRKAAELVGCDLRRMVDGIPESQIHVVDITDSQSSVEFPQNVILRARSISSPGVELSRRVNSDESLLPIWMLDAFVLAEDIASRVAGESFDYVEICDDSNVGFLVRPALANRAVKVAKYVLADSADKQEDFSHSDSLKRDWLKKALIENQSNLINSSYAWYERIRKQLKSHAVEDLKDGPQIARSEVKDINQSLGHVYKQLRQLPETSPEQLAHKLQLIWDINTLTYLDRVTLWYEIARLERLRGQLPYWLVYQLRMLKNLNYSIDSSVVEIQSLLRQANYCKEADVVARMYSKGLESEVSFDSFAQNHMFLQEFKFEKRIEYKTSINPKVSVIVSMYNADNKLEVFLKLLSEQTLHRQGLLEIVLVDSASPGKELEVATRLQQQFGLSLTYVRSKTKETIQTAWNQGISVSRAPYLSFLGVDETVKQDALELLASKLDSDRSIDWVTGSAVAFDVDWSGKFEKQTLFYDRADSVHDQIFFDTTQLSWVGALYRRDIHNRFGYYDGSFTAAGDTEFKNRIFPYIKSYVIPEILGFYMNYPEERMTEHPRAEIEDLRALYWYKTPAGVEYSYRSKSVAELEAQIIRAVGGFRKTFGNSLCTDLDYGASALKVLRKRAPDSKLLQLSAGVDRIIKAFQKFEYITPFSQATADEILISTQRILQEVSAQHAAILGKPELNYAIIHDNRFQYYNGPWRNLNAKVLNAKDGQVTWI